jgi:hypothetical protein
MWESELEMPWSYLPCPSLEKALSTSRKGTLIIPLIVAYLVNEAVLVQPNDGMSSPVWFCKLLIINCLPEPHRSLGVTLIGIPNGEDVNKKSMKST